MQRLLGGLFMRSRSRIHLNQSFRERKGVEMYGIYFRESNTNPVSFEKAKEIFDNINRGHEDCWYEMLDKFQASYKHGTVLFNSNNGEDVETMLNNTSYEHICWMATKYYDLIGPHYKYLNILALIMNNNLETMLNRTPQVKALEIADGSQLDKKALGILTDKAQDLEHLTIFHYPDLDNEGFLRLNLPKLKTLCIMGTKKLDQETFDWVVNHLPNLKCACVTSTISYRFVPWKEKP